MSRVLFCLLLPLLVTSTAGVAAEKNCQVANPTGARFDLGTVDNYGLFIIGDSKVAQVLYDAMVDVKEEPLTEEEVPKGVAVFRKSGASIRCFRQVLESCVFFSCNLPFADVKKGLVQ